jgi:hypothetical protein
MCRHVWGRAPGKSDRDLTRAFLAREKERASVAQPERDETSLWTGLARSLFSSAAFRMLD